MFESDPFFFFFFLAIIIIIIIIGSRIFKLCLLR